MKELNGIDNVPKEKDVNIDIKGNRKLVSNIQELNNAMAESDSGDIIILSDGIYSGYISTLSQKHGMEQAPIIIRAEHSGKAQITGDTGFHFSNCSFINLEGIKFTGSGKKHEDGHYRSILLESCRNMRVDCCHFKLEEVSDNTTIVLIRGENSCRNYIGYNLFDGKHKSGLMLDITGGKSQVSMYDTIEFNHFRDNVPWIENGKETVRIGLSYLSPSSSSSVIQNNLFENCGGEPEIISIKTCDTEVRYNTFLNSRGQVVLRHGDRNKIHGNYFIVNNGTEDAGGVRVYGCDHKIYNNYMQGLTASAIQIDKGDAHIEGKLTDHWTPRRIDVCFNTIIDCEENIEIGKRYLYKPENCVIANNIITGSRGYLINEYCEPVNFIYMRNIVFPKGDAFCCNTYKNQDEILVIDPVIENHGEVYMLSASSPAINNAVGDFVYVAEDVDRILRDSKKDIGAQEHSINREYPRIMLHSMVGPLAIK